MSALTRLVGIGFAVAVIGFSIAGCGDSIKDKVNEAKTTINDVKTTVDDVKDTVDDATVKGGAENSYYQEANLNKAVEQLKDKVGDDGDLLELTIYPGYVQADASTGSESEGKRYRINADGDLKEGKLTLTSVAGGKLADNIFPISDVDAGTITSTISSVADKAGKTLDDVTYAGLRISAVDGKPQINVYLSGGDYYTADLDGGNVKNVSGAATSAVKDAQKTADCIKKAGTDVSKIQACAK